MITLILSLLLACFSTLSGEQEATTTTFAAENNLPHGAITQFARLLNKKARQFDKKSKQHTNLDYAQVYFNYLYTHGSRDTQKTLTLLAFELEVVLAQKSWSTEKKYLAFNAFLTNAFSAIESTLRSKLDKDKLQRMYKHLQAGISPTIMGRQETIKNLPWKRMALAGATIAGGIYAYKTNAIQKARASIVRSFEAVGHIGENLREASREREAFFAHIEHDANKSPIRRWDKDSQKFYFLVKGKPLPSLDQKTDYTDKTLWLEAPAGIVDRAIGVLEAAKPLLPQLSEKLLDATEEQNRWFAAHGISTDRLKRIWAPVYWTENGVRKQEMRYAADMPLETQPATVTNDNPNKLWQDNHGKWHATYLPDRNIAERLLVVTERTITALESEHMKALITTISAQLKNNQDELIAWMKDKELIDENQTKPYPLRDGVVLLSDPETKKLYYQKTTGLEKDKHIPFPESMFDRLITTADKLATQIGDTDSSLGSLLKTTNDMLTASNTELTTWLRANNLCNETPPYKLKDNVRINTDERGKKYYYLVKDRLGGAGEAADGTTSGEKRIYPPMSSTDHLFVALGKLAEMNGTTAVDIAEQLIAEATGIRVTLENKKVGTTSEKVIRDSLLDGVTMAARGNLGGARLRLAELKAKRSTLDASSQARGLYNYAIRRTREAIDIKQAESSPSV